MALYMAFSAGWVAALIFLNVTGGTRSSLNIPAIAMSLVYIPMCLFMARLYLRERLQELTASRDCAIASELDSEEASTNG